MQEGVAVGQRFDKGANRLFLRGVQQRCDVWQPSKELCLAIWQRAAFQLDGVQLLEQGRALCAHLRNAAPVGVHDLRHGPRVDQLVHHAVTLTAADDVVGNGRGHSCQKRLLCGIALVLYHVQGDAGIIDLHNGLGVGAVHSAEAAGADKVAALDGHLSQALPHVHQCRKPRDVEYLVDLWRHVQYGQRASELLAKLHKDAQAGGRYVLQLAGIDGDLRVGVGAHRLKEL